MEKMDTQQLIRHIHRSDLTALEKRYLEWLVEAQTPREGMRLIDAEALEAKCMRIINIEWNNRAAPVSWAHAYSDFCEDIAEMPTIEAEPVRHGRWIAQDEGRTRFMCSECESKNHGGYEKYCPNCGAKMIGKENENE